MPFSFPSSPSVGATSTQNGRTYTYAGNNVWELAASGGEDTVLRALFVPAAPTSVTATAGNAQATVSWTAPTGVIAQAPITDYAVQFSSNSGSSWSNFSDGTSTATSATVTGLTNGTAVQFRVAAANAVGTGSYSTASSAVTPTAGTPPGAPTGLTATAGNAQIALSWTAPASAGSSAITGYTVEYTPSGGSPTTVSTGSTATSYTITSLTNGTAYTARVAAVNAAGTGSYTAASSSVTPVNVVFRAIPTLTSNTSDGTASANTSAGGAAWNLFDNANTEYYTARNGSDTPKRFFQYTFAGNAKSYIGGYTMTGIGDINSCVSSWEFSGSDDGTNFTVIDTRSVSWSSGGQTQAFTLASPANYSTYRWTLTPDGTNDSFAGLRGAQLTAVPVVTPPAAPTSLTATGGNAQVSLAWTAPSDNGGSAITDYTVEYTPSGGSAQTVSTGSSSASYTLTGLTNGTAYTVRVAAVNAAGTGSYTAASSSVTPSAASLTVSPSSGTADIGTAYSWSGAGTAGSPLETSDAASPNGISWQYGYGANTYKVWQFTCGVSGTLTFELGAGFDGDGGAERPSLERYLRNGVQSTAFIGGTTNLGDHYIRRAISVSAGDVIRLGRASPAAYFASSEMLKGKIRLWIS